jgi:hypothetical protein
MERVLHYCKAYTISEFRRYRSWADKAVEPVETPDTSRVDAGLEPILFLQADLRVSDGILTDDHIVFADVTPDWEVFCRDQLKFALPVWCDGPPTSED